MSKNCNYVYVQGLRFRPEDVTVLWKDGVGVEHHVRLRKTGTGLAQFDMKGIPLSVTPKDLKKMLRKGETVNVIVHAMSESSTEYEKVMLRLDPRLAEGRKGRKAFDAESLAGMPPRGRRALALEQLKTAPYGAENRDQAVERILWGLENLDDKAIARMLEGERIGFTPAENLASAITPRSSTNVELAALLLSDRVLIAALMEGGKHESLSGLLKVAPLASAALVYIDQPAAAVFEGVAMSLSSGGAQQGDSTVRQHAAQYLAQPAALVTYLKNDADPGVRIALLDRLAVVGSAIGDPYGFSPSQVAAAKEQGMDVDALGILAGRSYTTYIVKVSDIEDATHAVMEVARGDSDPRVRLRALEFIAANEAKSGRHPRGISTRRDLPTTLQEASRALVLEVLSSDVDAQVRLEALQYVGDDKVLLDIAQTSPDSVTAKGAYDLVFARIAAGPDPQEREIESGWGEWTDFSQSNVVASEIGLLVAGSRDPEILERLHKTLAQVDASSASNNIKQAIELITVLQNNPLLPDAVYKEVLRREQELAQDLEIAADREREEEKTRVREENFEKWRNSYAEHKDKVVAGIRHARAGNVERATQFLYGEALLSAIAASTDPEEIRELAEYAEQHGQKAYMKAWYRKFEQQGESRSTADNAYGGPDRYAAEHMALVADALRANTATPSGIVEERGQDPR